MRKILALFLVAIIALGLVACGEDIPEGSSTVEMEPSEGLEYQLIEIEDVYFVSGIGSCTDTSIVIPAQHEGLP